ncbi:GerAB/ArcD/ProY family transporter [Peribacillus frigoritolerans]|uniref:GerAB/ArcD/ProY family transporter n=1 Tax=Peribacillus frigoritolerans TaxID=450367 RepID=UPI00382125B7
MKNDEELQDIFIPIIHFDCHFCYRTTVIFPLASDSKQAAWISILLGIFFGLPFLIFYGYLNRQYPDLLLTEYCKKIPGKYIGTIIGIFYILFLCMVLHEI